MVCPYSDAILYSKGDIIHRVTSTGSHSQISMGQDSENKEFLMAFAASDH